MKDYTTNNYCDFLWISDLLLLKKNSENEFSFETHDDHGPIKCSISNVIIFGTIVEVKEVGYKGVLYQVDDGTGVIGCKRNEEHFEEILRYIEQEQVDILNQTLDIQHSFEQSCVSDTSGDDSIFNDRSVQIEDINFNRRSRLRGLQSLWDDIYKSFSSLIEPFSIGDSVVINGKLYSYFNKNQIHINNITGAMDLAEEIMQLTLKLEDGFPQMSEANSQKTERRGEKRHSGLVTFDNIPHPNPKVCIPTIDVPEWKDDVLNSPGIVTPNLNPTITFDTFTSFFEATMQQSCK